MNTIVTVVLLLFDTVYNREQLFTIEPKVSQVSIESFSTKLRSTNYLTDYLFYHH
jgi:hypothetical protein